MDQTPPRLHQFFRGKTATLHVGGKKPTGFKSFGPGRPWFRIIAGLAVVGALAVGVAWGEGKVQQLKLRYEGASVVQTVKSGNSIRNSAWQARYQNALPDRKIFYVDSDAIDLAMGVGIMTGQPSSRAEILMQMIHDRTGIWVNPYMVPMLEQGFADGHTEFSVQMGRDHGLILRDGAKNTVCIIVPTDPNHSARGIISMVSGVPEEGLRWFGADGRPMFDLATLRDYVDAHETAHCLDPRWAGDQEAGTPELNRHKAELFADVHSTLLLAQQGKTDLARKLADVRAMGLATAGRALATRAVQKGEDPAGAVVYSMSFALLATQDYIDQTGVAALKQMTPAQLRAKSYEIVEKHAMTDSQLSDLGYFLAAGDKFVEYLKTTPTEKNVEARIANLTKFSSMIKEATGRMVDREALQKAALAKLMGIEDTQGYTQETFEAKVEELWKTEILDKARAQGGGVTAVARAITNYRNAVRDDIGSGKTVDIARLELLKNIGLRLSILDDATWAVIKQQPAGPARQGPAEAEKPKRPPPIMTEPTAGDTPPLTIDRAPSPSMGRKV